MGRAVVGGTSVDSGQRREINGAGQARDDDCYDREVTWTQGQVRQTSLETIAFLSSLVLAGIFITLFMLEKRARDAEKRE